EGSWEEDAVVADPDTGVFVDPAKVHAIEHDGTYFAVPGIAITEPSVQRTPVIYQAGTSPRGTELAASHAEADFVTSRSKEQLKHTVTRVRDAVQAAGRDRYDVRIFAMQTVITAATDAAAWEKFDDYRSYIDTEGALTLVSGWMGVDLSTYDLDQPIGDVESNAIQSTVTTFQQASGTTGQPWSVREIAEWVGVGGFGPLAVGSGESVAHELISWQQETDVDGFNLAYAVTPGTFEDIVEFVVPALQRLGAYKTEYTDGSLRHKLFGRGSRLPQSHPGAGFRVGSRHLQPTGST